MESNAGKNRVVYVSTRKFHRLSRFSLEFFQEILAGKGPRESQPRKVGQACLAEALPPFFFVSFPPLALQPAVAKKDTTRLDSRRQRKIGASLPRESCICFPLCIIFPCGPPTIFPAFRPSVFTCPFHVTEILSMWRSVASLIVNGAISHSSARMMFLRCSGIEENFSK